MDTCGNAFVVICNMTCNEQEKCHHIIQAVNVNV